MPTFRLNYGNGQTSGDFHSYKTAAEAYRRQRDFDRRGNVSSGQLRIEVFTTNEWEAARTPTED